MLHNYFQDIMETVQAGILIHDADTSIRYSNTAACQLLGLTSEQLQGKKVSDPLWLLLTPRGTPMTVGAFPVSQAIANRAPVNNMTVGIKLPDHTHITWLKVSATPIVVGDAVDKIIVSFVDITSENQATSALRNSQISIQRIIDSTPLGVCVTDEYGYFESVNQAYCKLYGFEEPELLGKHFSIVVPDEQKELLTQLHNDFIQNGAEIRGEWDVVRRDGEVMSILADAALIKDVEGRPKKVTFVMNITEEKQNQKQLEEKNFLLEQLTQTDQLTGVANRRCIFETLETEIMRSKRYDTPVSIIMLDLDHFKGINDTFGHQTGDLVLKAAAATIKEQVREVDTVGRYGGEEFIVIMPETPLHSASTLAERIRLAIANMSVPEVDRQITASLGVATYSGQSLRAFIKSADDSLYVAKRNGRNKVETSFL